MDVINEPCECDECRPYDRFHCRNSYGARCQRGLSSDDNVWRTTFCQGTYRVHSPGSKFQQTGHHLLSILDVDGVAATLLDDAALDARERPRPELLCQYDPVQVGVVLPAYNERWKALGP